MRRLFALLVLVAAIPVLAQNGPGNECTLAGTWYGGMPEAGFPYYQAAITSQGGDRYSIVYQYFSAGDPGLLHATDWKGDLIKRHGQSYTGLLSQMLQLDPSSPLLPPDVDANLPEMDFIHIDHLEFIDCDTIRITYDKWYVYFNFTNDIKPLQPPPPPGFIWTIDPPLVEVYHRTPAAGAASLPADMISISPETQVKQGALPPRVRPRNK